MRTLSCLVVLAGCSQVDPPTDRTAHADPAHGWNAPHPAHHPKPPRPPRPCTAKHDNGHNHDHKHDIQPTTCSLIGSDGGIVQVPNGPTLTLPSGAVDRDTEIGIAVSTAPAPSGAVSARYTFTPSGLVFNMPVAIAIPVNPGTTAASLYWSNLAGTGFDRLAATVAGGALHSAVVHFSDGYGAPAAGALAINLALATNHYVDGVPDGAIYPDLAAYAPVVYLDDGSPLVPPAVFTPLGNGEYTATLPAGTTSYTVGVSDPTYTTLFYATSKSSLDIGTDTSGRALAAPAAAGTKIALTVGGLDPWDVGDQLHAYSEGAGMQWADLEGADAPADGFAVDLPGDGGFLLGATDQLDVGQETNRVTSGGIPYLAQTRVFETSFTQANGTTNVTANLTTGHPHSATFDLHATEFDTLFGLDNGVYAAISATAYPDIVELWYYGSGCSRLPGACASFNAPFDSNTVATLDFATASSTQKNAGATFVFNAFAQLQLPSTSQPAGFLVSADGEAAAGDPIVPIVGPISNVKIDGQALNAPVSGLGTTTPLVTWDAPSTTPPLMSADHYLAVIVELYDDGAGRTRKVPMTPWLTTDETQLRIPAGLLQLGHHYAIRINAEHASDLQRFSMLPRARTRWLSDIFTP